MELCGGRDVEHPAAGLIPLPPRRQVNSGRRSPKERAASFFRKLKPRAQGPGFSICHCYRSNALAHSDAHAAEIERGLEANLPSTHFNDNAILVPEARRRCATGNRNTGADCSVCTDDILRAAQVERTLNPPTLNG
jgi:hypothetical protein